MAGARRLRTLGLALGLLSLGSCGEDLDRPPVQASGTYLSYAAPDALGLCPGTVDYAEAWMATAASQMGLDASALPPMTYSIVDQATLEAACLDHAAGCARLLEDGSIEMFSDQTLHRHELVHALHFAAWPERPLMLEEGLAHGWDDWSLWLMPSYSADEIAEAATVPLGESQDLVMWAGAYLQTALVRREGPEAVARLWQHTHAPTTETEFRADFERAIGESLDEFIASLDSLVVLAGDRSCPVVSCVGQPKPWAQDIWTTRSPDGCDDHSYGSIGSDYEVYRFELMRIETEGEFEVTVSEGSSGTAIVGCGVDFDCSWLETDAAAGQTKTVHLPAGTYRVGTAQHAADDMPYTVEIRRAN